MNAFAPTEERAQELERALMARDGKDIGRGEIRFRCPVHSPDAHPSARYNRVMHVWTCDTCSAGGGFIDLARRVEIEVERSTRKESSQVVATYTYADERGEILFDVVRSAGKKFRQRRPDGQGGHIWNLDGVRRVLYDLPNVLAVARAGWRVYVVEGEKDADAITALGLMGTTSPGGAGKWNHEYSDALTGAEVIVIADKDTPGRQHGRAVADSCLGKARVVKVIELPGDDIKDTCDWLSAGGTKAELELLADAAPEWSPAVADFDDSRPFAETPPHRPARGPVVVRMDAVEVEAVEWTWDKRVPRGKVTLIVGDPGLGKSFLTLDMAARCSRGLAWPEGGDAPLGDVVIMSAEDGLADTIAPRLVTAGADRSRVHALTAIRDEHGERAFDLSRDVAQLALVLSDLRSASRVPVLVVIDPITAYLGRDVDSHVAADVRGALAPLASLAERERVAIVCVAHLNKTATRALYRVSGSLAFVAAARAVLAVAADPDDPAGRRRILGSLKSNLGLPPPTLAFRVDDGRVIYDGTPVHVDITTALRGPDEARERAPRDEAADFLRDVLSDGPVAAKEVARLAVDARISPRTLERSRARVGVVSIREGGLGAAGRWVWTLRAPQPRKTATPEAGGLSAEASALDEHAPDDGDEMVRAALDLWPGAAVKESSGRDRAADIVS